MPYRGPGNPGNPYAPLNQLPLVGPWIGRMGAIHEIFATPCATTPQIWVKAAFAAAPALINIIATPFPFASTYRRLLPGGRCQPKFPMTPGIEMGDGGLAARNLVWHVFTVLTEFILKLEWYFFIIDKVTEFEYNWVSMAYAYAGCKNPDNYWIEGSRNDGLVITNGTWQLVGPLHTTDYRGIHGEQGTFGVPAGFSGVFNGSLEMQPIEWLDIPKGSGFTLSLTAPGSFEGTTAAPSNPTLSGSQRANDAFPISNPAEQGQTYGLFINGPLGAWRLTSATAQLYYFQTGHNGLGVANPNIMFGR